MHQVLNFSLSPHYYFSYLYTEPFAYATSLIIKEGVLDRITQVLDWNDSRETQLNALWILTNMSTLGVDEANAVTYSGFAEKATILLDSGNDLILEQVFIRIIIII